MLESQADYSALLSQLRDAVRADVSRSKFGLYKTPLEALRAISREFFKLSPNQVRQHYSLPLYSKTEDAAASALRSICDSRPVTAESVLAALCALPGMESKQQGALDALAVVQAKGMLKFMHLARSAMKHGKQRLEPAAIVAELQNDFVTKAELSKFNDKSFYRTREWKELRLAVLSAMPRCCLCGAGPDSGPLHVDHVKPRSLWPELSLEPSNMQTLCGPCNLAKSNVVAIRY